ncbi:MAG: hypothetical protein K6F70_00255 [Eggerthellaceae bacterium]|nr:hypothetical protein [Eggerthellaceae bacterium]
MNPAKSASKHYLALLLAVVAVAIAVALAAPASAYAASDQKMYRLYNPNGGEHFYTANVMEMTNLHRLGWNYEGVGWIAPASGAPVYRLYNPNGGDHHYTMAAEEKDFLVALGWNYEGVGWRSASASAGQPLYRQYNPNASSGSHNYTLSAQENDHLVSLGWNAEGVCWYGYEPSESDFITLLDYSQAVNLPVSVSAYSVVVAREDGVVIAGKAPNKKCETGSTAKLMTCWLAQESLGDAQVTLSDYDIQIAQPFAYDRDQPWKTNSASIVAKQCMYVSSNPYAHTLARYVAREKYGATGTDWGDMRNGVRAMQERAVEIGMTNTTFVSPSGLFGPKNGNFTQDFSSNSKGLTNNRSTGNDMMLLTLNAVPAGTHIVGNTFGSPHKFTNIKTGTNERESMLSMIRIKGKTYYIALMAADHTSSQGGTDVKETTAIVNWLWDYVQ